MAEKVINYSDTEKAIVSALAEADGTSLTLAELSKVIGKELKSGNINALVKKGNIEVAGDRTIVCACCGAKKVVKEYRFVKAI